MLSLELQLGFGGRSWLEPWEGRDPRLLTKLSKMIRLGPRPPGGSACGDDSRELTCPEKRELIDVDQLLLRF